ncbi:putative nuclease HARBI1 [Photinus pyralis]|nr:putative nuclease HARBI1 [Photinus pyralis]
MDVIDDILLFNEMDIINNIERRPYNTINTFRHVDNFHEWDETDFVRRFRLSKASVLVVLELIQGDIRARTNRNNPIAPLQQLLLTLRFFASGSFYITVSDFGGIHKSTAAQIIKRTVTALCQLRRDYIYFPRDPEEQHNVKAKFCNIAAFPRVLGALDGTHIRIQSPGGQQAETFRNRKGYFSLNVISDAKHYIRNIVTRWPGSSHDANIFDNSLIRMQFENGEMGNGLLLGDSAYPLRSYLITPINNPQGEIETLFNESLIRTRTVVERTFGIWKRRFPILSVGMRCRVELAQNIIVATAVIHNIARQERDAIDDLEDDPLIENVLAPPPRNDNDNHHHRRELLEYFEQLYNHRN